MTDNLTKQEYCKECKSLRRLDEWIEKSKGYYRYVTEQKVFYELIVIKDRRWNKEFNEPSNAALALIFVTNPDKWASSFDREFLGAGPINQCLETAANDYNNKFIMHVR